MSPVYLIKPDDVQDLWIGVRPLLENALVHSEGAMTSTDTLRSILIGEFQLWVGFDRDDVAMAAVSEIITYPRHKILRVHTWATDTGHDFDIWYPQIMISLEEFAGYTDCVALEAWCRKGLARKLDWDNEYSVIVKLIKGEKHG